MMPRQRTVPPLDDMESVLVVLIGRSLTVRQIRKPEWAGLDDDRTRAALRELDSRDLARTQGAGHWAAYQRNCARCHEPPVGGHEVVFDPETLRWFHSDCWAQGADEVRRLVNTDQGGDVDAT